MSFKKQTLTEDEWWSAANEYAITLNYCTSGNFEDYKDYFDDGYTPDEAIREDISYCD